MADETVYTLVSKRLGSDAAETLFSCLAFHYHQWKFQRRSDESTLTVAKHILCNAKFARLCRAPGWIINRGKREYEELIGPHHMESAINDQIRNDRLQGSANPYDEVRWMD